MRFGRMEEASQLNWQSARRRTRPSAARASPASSGEPQSFTDDTAADARRLLIVAESDGSVFDTIRFAHETGFLPAFCNCFSWGLDAEECADLWRGLSLSSKLRGQNPSTILLHALRILNRRHPSIRRSAVLRAVESRARAGKAWEPEKEEYPPASPERLVYDWLVMSEELIADAPGPRVFDSARSFLLGFKGAAPGAELLAYSFLPESQALDLWDGAGLGASFLRVAGRERGDFLEYLRAALRNGYDSDPILVIGSTLSAWQAAQGVGARFYPILPGDEERCWQELADFYFPAFAQGELSLLDRDMREFMVMVMEDVDNRISSAVPS